MIADQLSYSLPEAAAKSGMSLSTIRRAVNTTDPRAYPPPLKAKRESDAKNAKKFVLHKDLEDWLDRYPDA